MSNALDRIVDLLSNFGIDPYGYFTYSEIAGYCAGIKLVSKKVDDILRYIFINIQDNDDLSYYKAFIKSTTTKESIMNRLGESYGYYGIQDLLNSIGDMHESFVSITPQGIVFDGIEPKYYSILGGIATGRFPKFFKTMYGGTGKTFDEWQAWDKCWIELDNMGLPFDIIDTLRGEQNE